jgi:hypothetical protein
MFARTRWQFDMMQRDGSWPPLRDLLLLAGAALIWMTWRSM